MESTKRKSLSAGWHWTPVLIAVLLWPAVALGAGASEVFQKVKDAIVVVKALDREGQEVSQGSGVVLPSGQVTIKNLAVPSEWQGELIAQSKKAEPPPGAKSPERAQAPDSSSEPRKGESDTTWLSQAKALEAAKDWSSLLEHCKRWIRAEPGEPAAWAILGGAYLQLGRHQEAADAYKEALRLKPDYAEAWNNLGVAYGYQGRHQEAADAHKEAVRLKPGDAQMWINLSAEYGTLGRHGEAAEAAKEALRLNHDNAAAWVLLGIAHRQLGMQQEAVFDLRKALRLKPDYAQVWAVLALVYWDLGDRTEALKAVQELRRYDPAQADELFNQIMGK
jgi:tetratricopeptide (TPR) repeat protein